MGKFVGSRWVPDYAGEAEPQRIGSRIVSPTPPPPGPGSYRPPSGNTGVTGGMIGGTPMATPQPLQTPTAPPPATPPPPVYGPAGTPGNGRPGPRIYGDWRDFQPGGAYFEEPPAAPSGPAPGPAPQTAPPSTPPGPAGRTGDASGFGRAWLASGGRTVDDLRAFIAANPQYGAELFGSKGDKVRIGGRAFDAVIGAGAGGQGGSWYDISNAGPADPRLNDGIRGNARGGPAAGGQGNVFTNQVRQLLLKQLQEMSKPVSADDPLIAGELQAQERLLERNRQARRESFAERAAMQGLLSGGQSSGAFDAEVASGFEDKGQALTGIQAQLFARELQGRRTQVAHLLNMALQSGDAESARALQLQLANMDNELRRYGLQQQQSQFNDQFGLQRSQFEYDMDRDAARATAGLPF